MVKKLATCGHLTYMQEEDEKEVTAERSKERRRVTREGCTVQMRRSGFHAISVIHAQWVIQLSRKEDGVGGEFRGEGQDRIRGGEAGNERRSVK